MSSIAGIADILFSKTAEISFAELHNLRLDNIQQFMPAYNPCMASLDISYRTHGYNRVLNVGLPLLSGRYFVVVREKQMLLLADLIVQEDGSHAWLNYESGSAIQESLITMWKPIHF